jgi:hypothetical protein
MQDWLARDSLLLLLQCSNESKRQPCAMKPVTVFCYLCKTKSSQFSVTHFIHIEPLFARTMRLHTLFSMSRISNITQVGASIQLVNPACQCKQKCGDQPPSNSGYGARRWLSIVSTVNASRTQEQAATIPLYKLLIPGSQMLQ